MNWHFVRHGEILSNRNRVYAGWSDESLTDTGLRQAQTVAKELGTLPIAAIHSSPLQRTMQTATVIGQSLGLVPLADKSFIEMQLGPWEGLSEAEIAARYPDEWQRWNSRPAELQLPGRETLRMLQDRVLAGIARIAAEPPGDAVLVVTHVGIIRVLLLHVASRDLNDYRTIPVDNCTVFSMPGLDALLDRGERNR